MSVYRICLMFLGCAACLTAQDVWQGGAFYRPDLTDSAELYQLGDGRQIDSAQYLPGLVRASAKSRKDLFLLGSNRLMLYYSTPGELTVERFEQLGQAPATGVQQCRLILYIDEGILTVDSSSLSVDSQFVVETPLGRLDAGAGRWTLSLAYDARTRMYNLTLESIDLELVFKTHSGERVVVSGGQMLNGAGTSTLRDLEVSDLLRGARDRLAKLEQFSDEALAEVSMARLNSHLRPIAHRGSLDPQEGLVPDGDEDAVHGYPIVIEYSPRPKPLVPFRGVGQPPSEF